MKDISEDSIPLLLQEFIKRVENLTPKNYRSSVKKMMKKCPSLSSFVVWTLAIPVNSYGNGGVIVQTYMFVMAQMFMEIFEKIVEAEKQDLQDKINSLESENDHLRRQILQMSGWNDIDIDFGESDDIKTR